MRDYEDVFTEETEKKLLEKFYDYTKLEEQISKKGFLEIDSEKSSIWSYRFVISSVVQAFVILGFTLFIMVSMAFDNQLGFMTFLQSTSGILFISGFILYLGFIVSLTIIGIFYNYLEVVKEKKIVGLKNMLTWIPLLGINLGGMITILSLILTGLSDLQLWGNTLSFTPTTFQFISGVAILFFVSVGIGGFIYFYTFFKK